MPVVDYPRTMSAKFDVEQLKNEINSDLEINPSCVAIVNPTKTLCVFQFTTSLTTAEETRLDLRISSHVPEEKKIDVAQLPLSNIEGGKLAVHNSAKPLTDKVTYAMWTGAGDDITDPDDMCGGELLTFDMKPGTPMVEKKLEFNPAHGKVWVHEAYLKFENGTVQDYIEAVVVYRGSPLLTHTVPLDLEVYGDSNEWVRPASGGPGTGTHGFAGTPVLIPRTFSSDGDWDYDEVQGLRPSVPGQGYFKISTVDVDVHNYYNKIPCLGSSSYFSMTSDETSWLMPGTYVRIRSHNISDTEWCASVIVEIYRERTLNP